jgi:hypothetical protein
LLDPILDIVSALRKVSTKSDQAHIDMRTSSTSACLLLQDGSLSEELDLSEAQEDQAEDRLGVLGGSEAGIGAELVRRRPQAVLQRLGASVFLRRRYPLHES